MARHGGVASVLAVNTQAGPKAHTDSDRGLEGVVGCVRKTPMATKKRSRAHTGKDSQVTPIMDQLKAMGSAKNRASMVRYGINIENAFGVSVYELRALAKHLGNNHQLALTLWATGNHEARLLACFVDDPVAVTEQQTEAWASDFNSWDICDQATTSLFDRTEHGWTKAVTWAKREEEWVKRGGFALMAGLAMHDKTATDRAFMKLFPLIIKAAFDDRNFVKKAVNWALRNIGKRNQALNAATISTAENILAAANRRAGGERGGDLAARSARWVATDALRELTSQKVQTRLLARQSRSSCPSA
jgi:3-methyladenine DNA glycosylase AlkD